MDQLPGEIRLITYDDIPAGWLKCEGQSLAITQYPLLYRMIGTKFGQEGKFKFLLPDLREKTPPGLAYCIAAEGRLPGIQGEEDGLGADVRQGQT
jgi:microcystin-dependent protein